MTVVVEEERVEVAKTGVMRGAALNEHHGHQVSSRATLDPDAADPWSPLSDHGTLDDLQLALVSIRHFSPTVITLHRAIFMPMASEDGSRCLRLSIRRHK